MQALLLQPALVVLALQLPSVAGITVVRVLRNIPTTRHIPMIAMALECNLPHALRQIPNVEVLVKPFTQDALLHLVTAYTQPMSGYRGHRYATHPASNDVAGVPKS